MALRAVFPGNVLLLFYYETAVLKPRPPVCVAAIRYVAAFYAT